TTGFAMFDPKPLLVSMGAAGARDAFAGITPADLIGALDGPITMTSHTDPPSMDIRVPFSNTKPIETLLAHCEDPALGALGTKLVDGVCKVPVPQMGTTFDMWVDGKELRAGEKGKGAGGEVPMSPLGKELAEHEWHLAMWGRGSVFAPLSPLLSQQL